jgi:predicted HTH transcriptional regulator
MAVPFYIPNLLIHLSNTPSRRASSSSPPKPLPPRSSFIIPPSSHASESQHLEYKSEITDSLEREVVGFLNSREGGRIFVGVDDAGTVLGLTDADGDQLRIKDRLRHNIQPSCLGLFDVLMEDSEGRPWIKLLVASGPEKSYYLRKQGMSPRGCFLRIGSAREFFEGYSIPRNKELMRIFRDLDMVEYLGSGMPRILRAYPKKCFRFSDNFTRIAFPFSGSEKTSEKTSEKILRMIREDNHITIALLSEKIGVSTRSIERTLKTLQKQGALVRQGPDKGGRWQILP